MNELPGESMEVTPPSKPRLTARKVLVRLSILLLVYAIIIAAFYGWIWSLELQVQAELDDIVARSEPIIWAELQPEPVPDDQNAALLYLELSNIPLLVGETEESRRLKDIVRGITLKDWPRSDHAEDVAEILRQGQPGLDLCRRARALPGANWGYDYSQSVLEMDFDKMGDLKFMSAILSLAAQEAHDGGDDERSLGYLLDLQHIPEIIYSESNLIPFLIALHCEYWALQPLVVITHNLDIPVGTDARLAAQSVLAKLIDETAISQARVMVCISERAFIVDIQDRLTSGEGEFEESTRLAAKLPPFMLPLNELILLRQFTANVRATEFDNWPETLRALPDNSEMENAGPLKKKIYFLADLLGQDAFNKVHKMYFRRIALRRMAATALAMRMYEVDNGARPDTLDKLVPEYLPAVPDDPFFEGKREISYAPDAEKPILYSVWLDGADGGGEYTVYDDGGGVDIDESPDLVFFLNGDRPVESHEVDKAETQPVSAEAK